ncbi:YcxB family protein [Olsenella massiliensis]|uniref:YcxB family protein n=1 Tax=Olsenella massiliensis TaxID=1622075 RepID=UPI00071C2AEE|nr:YcxB family protein [Olsenella massiliensis]
MGTFRNEYAVDEDAIKEYASSWLRRAYFSAYNRSLCVVLTLLGALSVVCALTSLSGQRHMLLNLGGLDLLLGAALLAMWRIRLREVVKVTQARVKLVHKDDRVARYEFHDDACVITAKDGAKTQTLPLSSIRDRYESERFYFVVFDGAIIVQLSKTGFTLGTFEDFKARIEAYPAKRPLRARVVGLCLTCIAAANIYVLCGTFPLR